MFWIKNCLSSYSCQKAIEKPDCAFSELSRISVTGPPPYPDEFITVWQSTVHWSGINECATMSQCWQTWTGPKGPLLTRSSWTFLPAPTNKTGMSPKPNSLHIPTQRRKKVSRKLTERWMTVGRRRSTAISLVPWSKTQSNNDWHKTAPR